MTRLEEISKLTDILEYIRKRYGMSDLDLQKEGYCVIGCMLGELDTLEELHRLLYEYN